MSELQKWYWNAAGMQASGQPDDRPFFEAADVEAWLEANVDAREANGLHVCVDTLLAQLQEEQP